MVTRSYDPDRLGDSEYVEWLRSWNVDVDNLPEMKAKSGAVTRVVTPNQADSSQGKTEEGQSQKTEEKDQNPSAIEVEKSSEQTQVGGERADKDYEKWSLKELQEKAGKLEISKSGTISDLAKRIRETEG